MYTSDATIPVKRYQLNGDKVALVEKPPAKLFLRGPIPMDWLSAAAHLPGKTLHLANALWWLKGMSKGSPFKLAPKALDLFDISRDAVLDGLNRLESVGLIRVERKAGSKPVVTIIDAP